MKQAMRSSEVCEASRNEKQALVHARAELDRVRKAQELLVRDERVRWTLLVNRVWKALERSLGKAALVSLSGLSTGTSHWPSCETGSLEAALPVLTRPWPRSPRARMSR